MNGNIFCSLGSPKSALMESPHQYHVIFIGGLAGVEQDLLPFAIAIGHRAEIAGPNVVGLRRTGFEKSQIHGHQ